MNAHTSPEIVKGDRVVGLGRNDRSWEPARPLGVVTSTFVVDGERFYRVAWIGTVVEDDMRLSEIERDASAQDDPHGSGLIRWYEHP